MKRLRLCLALYTVSSAYSRSGCVGASDEVTVSARAAASADIEGATAVEPAASADIDVDTSVTPAVTNCRNPVVTPSGVVDAVVGDEVRYIAGSSLTDLAAGYAHTCAVLTDGTARC